MDQVKKEYLKLNKNILLSFAVSTTVSAIVAQLLADQESYLNSTYTVIVGYAVWFSVFAALFYFDTRKKYGDLKKHKNLKRELTRIIASLGIGEVFYVVIRWSTQYYFLNVGFEPYIASLTSEAISIGSYMLVVTVSAKLTGAFKEN